MRDEKTCIIIPTIGEIKYLLELKKTLEWQTYNADIMFIGTNEMPKEAEEIISSIANAQLIARPRKYYGTSGGFFYGEKLAFERGYQKIIQTDIDAIPTDNRLVEKIINSLEKNQFVQSIQDEFGPATCVQHWTGIRREVFEKIGFTYAPYCMYWEDVEYEDRLKTAGYNRTHVDGTYSHPKPKIRKPIGFLAIARNSVAYYLYQKRSFARFFRSRLTNCAWSDIMRKNGNIDMSSAIKQADKMGVLGEFGHEEEFGGIKLEYDKAETQNTRHNAEVALAGYEMVAREALDTVKKIIIPNRMSNVQLFANIVFRDIVVMDELYLIFKPICKKIRYMNPDTHKIYYEYTNGPVDLIGNMLRVFLLFSDCVFSYYLADKNKIDALKTAGYGKSITVESRASL